MTLNEALAVVHPWLGTWQPSHHCDGPQEPPYYCSHGRNCPHEVKHPMPPATDELAMAVLRKIPKLELYKRPCDDVDCWIEDRPIEAHDPRDAIIIAAATWLQSQEKQKEGEG